MLIFFFKVIKGQVNLIKFVSGTSFYAVVDAKNNFILSDIDSADIKSSYQSFSDQTQQNIQVTTDVIAKEGTQIYVMTTISLSIRDLATMTDTSVPLKWYDAYAGAAIKIFKVLPTDSNYLYFGAEYSVQQQPSSIIVAYQALTNVVPPFSSIKISVQPDPNSAGPPATVSLLALALGVSISATSYHIVVGISGTQLYFEFIQANPTQPPAPESFWDLLQNLPAGTNSYQTCYYKGDTNQILVVVIGAQNKQIIYSYDLTQFTQTQTGWNTLSPTIFSNQIQTTINVITYASTASGQMYFFGAQQNPTTYLLLFGTQTQFSSGTQSSVSFTNQITAIEYIVGTSQIIVGSAVGEVFHYNFVTKVKLISKIPSEVDQYDSFSMDSSNQLIMLNVSKVKTFNIETYTSSSTSIVQSNTATIQSRAIYSSTRFARAYTDSKITGQPPNLITQNYLYLEIQSISNNLSASTTFQYLQITNLADLPALSISIAFLSSTTLAVGYVFKDASELAVFTYSAQPPSLQKTTFLSSVFQGKDISLTVDSNNNILATYGQFIDCYQFATNTLTKITLNTSKNAQDNSQTQGIKFLAGSLYLGVLKMNGPGQIEMAIFSYVASSLQTTYRVSANVDKSVTNIKYSSTNNLIVVYYASKYAFIYFDTTALTLTTLMSTQQLGSKTGIDYFIGSAAQLYIIQTSGIIKFNIGTSCLSTVCTQCLIETYYNIPLSQTTSLVSDNNGSGTSTSAYNTSNKFFNVYYDIINIFSSLNNFSEIMIRNQIKYGTRFNSQQYLFDIYNVYSQGMLGTVDQNQVFANAVIEFLGYDSTPSTTTATKFQYFFSATISFPTNLYSISFQDVEFSQANSFTGPMISSSANSLSFDNIGFSSTADITAQKVTNLQFSIENGQQFILQNSILSNLMVDQVDSLINTKTQMGITLDSVTFDSCSFISSSLITGQNPNLILKNSSINNSVIKPSPNDNTLLVFVKFASLIFNTFTISNSQISDTLLFQNAEITGQGSQNTNQNINIDTLNIFQNIFSLKQLQDSFGFTVTFSQVGINMSFQIVNSRFYSNTVSVHTDPSQPTETDPDTLSEISQNYFIYMEQVNSLILNTVDYIDNGTTGFIKGSQSTSLDLSTIKCSQTSTTLSVSQACCLNLQNHNKLNLSIKDSEFKNIYTSNSYVIQIVTTSFTQVGQNKFDCFVTITGTTFSNIQIVTTSEFITGSVINYSTLQKDSIILDNVIFSQISLTTPEKVFSPLGSALTIYAPFSYLEQNLCTFSGLTSNGPKGPQEINVKQIKITSGTFKNSNFAQLSFTQQGGFGKITTRQLDINDSTFQNANALTGGALILIPTVAQAIFSLKGNNFRMLMVSQDGGALLLSQSTSQSQFTIQGCTFDYIFAVQNGGCINIEYVLPTNDLIQSYVNCPTLIVSSNNISNVFSSQGGIAYVSNISMQIDTLTVSQIDSNIATTATDNLPLSSIYSQFNQIGPLFAIQQSDFSMKTSIFDDLKIHSSNELIQSTNFISASNYALVLLNGVTITNAEFSDSNFILFTTSKFTANTLTLTTALYKAQTSSVRLLEDISSSVSTGISVIKIQSKSSIVATGLVVTSVTCSSSKCFGGALFISESQGTITSSNFSKNSAETGGAVVIYNPSASITVSDTVFDGNTASQNGGGLFFQIVDMQQQLVINKSTFTNNSGDQGGGIYIEYIDTTATGVPTSVKLSFTTITDSTITTNKSNLFGGGIAFEGQYPQIDSATVIAQNESNQKFGSDTFSYPSKLKWDNDNTNKNRNPTIQLTSHYDDVNKITVYNLPNQQSGVATIPLVFNLVDSTDCVIDNTYTSLLSYKVTSTISADPAYTNNIFLNPLTNTYSYNNYFNYTALEISGIPGAKVRLIIESNAIVSVGSTSSTYQLALEYYLSYCVRGEVFKQYDVKTTLGTQTFYQCIYCTEGTYSIIYPKLEDPQIYTCKKCSVNAVCPGGDEIDLNSGYWRLSDQEDLLVSCENAPSNCLGGKTNSTCSEGHKGPLCESCDIANGFTRAGNFQCASCGDVLLNTLKVIGLMTFYVISAKMSVNGILGKIQEMWQQTNPEDAKILETNASIVLKLFLNYIQIFMVMTTFNISIPNSLNSGVSSISSPTVQVLYSFECFFYQITEKTGVNIIYIGLIFDLILPLVCVCLFIMTGFIVYKNNIFFRSFYIYTSLFYCLMYFQPNIFKDAISLVSCRDIGNKSYVRYNVLYECGTEEYDKWTVRFVLPVLIVLVIVIPGILVWRIKVNQDSKLGKRKFSFMTSEYIDKAYFWEIVKMNLKLLIMCSLTFFEHDIPNKIMSILFLVSLYAFMLTVYQPYKEELYNRIDTYSVSVLIISIYCGFIAFYNSGVFWIWILAIIVILTMNVAFVVWCIKKLIMAYIPLLKTKKEGFFSSLLAIRFFRNKFFKKERRLRFLWGFWLRSLVKQLKDMKLYNPLSFNPERHKISYKMITKALRDTNKDAQIQIVYDSEERDDVADENQGGDNKKYLKIIQISDTPLTRTQMNSDLTKEKDIFLKI